MYCFFKDSTNFFTITNPNTMYITLLIQIGSSYFCYIFAKFACKIKIQEFSMSLPLTIVGPILITLTYALAGLRDSNVCIFHSFSSVSDYLALTPINVVYLPDTIVNESLWIWILWWISQLWITSYIWHPRNEKNSPTEKLFVCPWYCGLLVDQCIVMNRRIIDWNDEYLSMQVSWNFYIRASK